MITLSQDFYGVELTAELIRDDSLVQGWANFLA